MAKTRQLTIVIAILASSVVMLDSSVINVALPAIARSLGGGLATQQWVIDGYLLTLSSLILLAGTLSDNFGRIRILKLGLIGFMATSLACAIAPTASFLVAARIAQGLAGALLVPSSLALIIAIFPEKQAQGKAIGTWTAWTGIAFLVGPLLGGALVDAASWRWIFAINLIPIGVTLWLLSKLHVPDASRTHADIDWVGAIQCALGLAGTTFALIVQPSHGWVSPQTLVPLVIGLGLLVSFFIYEQRTPHPMLPCSLFAIPNFLYGNLATLCIYAGLSASFIVTVFIQQTAHYSALQAGLALLPVTVIMFFASPRFGQLAGRFGPRFFMTVGPLMAAAGFLLLLRTGPGANFLTQVLPGVLGFGFGLSMTVAPLTSAVLGSVPPQLAGIGSAINNACARVAGLIAVAMIGIATGPVMTVPGFHRGLITIAALLAIGGVISAIGIRTLPASAPAASRPARASS